MIHPHTIVKFINEAIGHGVFATRLIPKGTVTWVMDPLDRSFTDQDLLAMHTLQREMILNHSFRNSKGEYIFCWDHTRYVNHSFRPNAMPTPYGIEVAIKDIQPGDQITNDYGFFNIIEPFEPMEEETGRRIVHPDDLKRHHEEWDTLLEGLLARIHAVGQPLQPLIPQSTLEEIDDVISGKKKMRSVLEMWYPGGVG